MEREYGIVLKKIEENTTALRSLDVRFENQELALKAAKRELNNMLITEYADGMHHIYSIDGGYAIASSDEEPLKCIAQILPTTVIDEVDKMIQRDVPDEIKAMLVEATLNLFGNFEKDNPDRKRLYMEVI